jgi:signal transduction histidine kinase
MQEILAEGELSQEELEKFKEYLSLMTTELERCGDIVTGLLSFSRQSGKEYSVVEINEILMEVIALTHHKMELQGINVNTELVSSPLEVYGDVNQMQQCFLNLIFNATEAMPGGGTLTVTSKLDNLQNRAVVTIRDTGQGIVPENMDYIFDPFFTTKQEGEGTGLGLSIVHGIVKTHKGDIEVSSRVGEGTEFVLFFPIQGN